MLVICCGMPRSASTWSYNVCMDLLKSTGESVYGGYSEECGYFLAGARAAHAVLKCHTLDAAAHALIECGAAKATYTYRVLPDAVVSFMRMFLTDDPFGEHFERAAGMMRNSLEVGRFCQQHGALMLNYEEIRTEGLEAVEWIAGHLQVRDWSAESNRRLLQIAQQNSIEQTRLKVESLKLDSDNPFEHDPETLLHKHHILNGGSGYGKAVLTPEQMAVLESMASEYPFLKYLASNPA